MKFATHVHCLFDAIRKGKILGGFVQETTELWVKRLKAELPAIQKAPVFVVRESLDDFIDESLVEIVRDQNAAGKITMPYPNMLLELRLDVEHMVLGENDRPVDDIWIVYAEWFETSEMTGGPYIQCTLFQTDIGSLNEWLVIPMVGHMYVGSAEMHHGFPFPADAESIEKAAYREQMRHDAISAATAFAATLVMMASPAIEIETVQVPRNVNLGRSQLQKARIPDHTVLHLPRIVYVADNKGGTHRRPKTHWRRPHTRYLKSGKSAEIPLTLVAKVEGQPLPPPPVTEIRTRK